VGSLLAAPEHCVSGWRNRPSAKAVQMRNTSPQALPSPFCPHWSRCKSPPEGRRALLTNKPLINRLNRDHGTWADTMDKLPPPILTDVLEVISTANESMDYRLVRQKALDALFRTIPSEGAIFFLPDGNGQFTHIKLKNLYASYCDYYKKHFYLFDPLHLTKGLSLNAIAGKSRQEKVFSYDSFLNTEYYNDFLRPQKIHHKLIVNLVAEKELYGRIVLTRPRRFNSFTRQEVLTVRTIAPYLSHALAHNNLRRKIKLKGTILDYIEKQSSIGMILLDENLQIIYSNDKAEAAIGKLKLSGSTIDQKEQLPIQLLKDCREIKALLKNSPVDGTSITRQSVIQCPDQTKFAITSRALEQEPDWEDYHLLLVSIEEKLSAEDQSRAKVNPQHLIDKFDLSKRETDVVELLFLGLKNAQIAQKLFISEVTVKKHLQNIYEKAGVSNRTALVNRILTA
jgi:DNA-binding CsgD family transcriptional regulator/GAF domain-containing protein